MRDEERAEEFLSRVRGFHFNSYHDFNKRWMDEFKRTLAQVRKDERERLKKILELASKYTCECCKNNPMVSDHDELCKALKECGGEAC